MAQTSGTYNFSPSVATFIEEAYERVQIPPVALTAQHVISARRSLNLILSDIGENTGVNLWAVDQLFIPLMPNQATYVLPPETVDLLDTYIRSYQAPSASSFVNIGSTLQAMTTFAGDPIIASPYGDPVVINPNAGVFTTTAGSQTATMRWPGHNQAVGFPIFWEIPVSVGGMAVYNFSIITEVVDSNNVRFMLPQPAFESMILAGGTALFCSTSGSPTVKVILPGHGLGAGDSFPVNIAVTVGGLTIPAGTYTVLTTPNDYTFTFNPAVGNATSTTVAFQNGGQPNIAGQASGVQFNDILMFPMSRNDYAALAVKNPAGRPTTFWLNRIVPPEFTIYPVAPSGSFYGFCPFRMRRIQDANPINGQVPDLAPRMWNAIIAELTAAVAEKYRPEAWPDKVARAKAVWDRAAAQDVERVTTHIVPAFQSYFR